MTSTMLVDRGTFASASPAPGQAATPQAGNWCVVPRCEVRVEKCKGGLKLHCTCDDDVACATLQNLCRSLSAGLCSVCCTQNGIPCCQVNLCCGNTKCELTKDGCCITCTSGDKACCDILQACCDALACCLQNGCCCYVCFNSTPVCCGCQAA